MDTSTSNKIKNLSIALEALSRINHPASGNAFEVIEDLLNKEISQAREENSRVKHQLSQLQNDDDIPF